MKKEIYLFFALAIFAPGVYAQPGSLDLSFGLGGINYTNIQNAGGNERAQAIVLQPDDKILVMGGAGIISSIYRYNEDGTLDNSFDHDGKLFFPQWGISGIALQADGKIIAVGSVSNGTNNDFAIARFSSDGTPDNDFGTGGVMTTDFNNLNDVAEAVAIQPDGKIVVAGLSNNGIFALARYNTEGSLDETFDGDGKLSTFINNLRGPRVFLVIQKDGKIVAGGDSPLCVGFTCSYSFTVIRYNADGSLDNSFEGDGKLTTNFGFGSSSVSRLHALALQGDGKILAAGLIIVGDGISYSQFAVSRFNTDGSFDNSFDGDGTLTTHFNESLDDRINGIAIQGDGKIVAAGESHSGVFPSSQTFALARYNTDGSLDNEFDGDGKLTTDVSSLNSPSYANSVAIQSDGNIVVAGSTNTAGIGESHIALTRYVKSDGGLDPGFDGDGIVVTVFPSSHDFATAMAVQSDGKLIVAGYTTSSNGFDNPQFALTRYNTNGSLDHSFDGDGILTAVISSFARATALAIQNDGKIVVAGVSRNLFDPYEFVIARFNADGTPDNTFDGDGIVFTSIGSSDDYATSLVIQPDGKLVVAGYSSNRGNYDFALVRFNGDGSLDITFDGDGKLTTAIGFSSQAKSVILQTDNKIVAAGYSDNGSEFGNDFALVRYNTDGSLDNSFDGDGKLTTDIGSYGDAANSVTIQSDGKIIAAGYTNSGYSGFALARYNTDGSLDNTFDGDGKLTTPIFSSYIAIAQSVAVEGDGKIVVAGRNEDLNTSNKNVVLLRYNTDGSLDNSFGVDGIVNNDLLGTTREEGWAMVLSGNKIFVAGTVITESQEDFLIAAYQNDVFTCPGRTEITFYRDEDGDGYGNASIPLEACSLPSGYADDKTDCDDNDAAVHPAGTEVCSNNIDDDCNGQVDEECNTGKLPKIYIKNTAIREGDNGTRDAIFELGLDKRSDKPITLQYHTADLTAKAPEDYVQKIGTVTFPPNRLTKRIKVEVKGDRLPEANEKFAIILSGAVNGKIRDGKATCKIFDDDPLPAIIIHDAVAVENYQQELVRVTLNEACEQVVTVKYYTKDGSAKAPADYTAINNGTLVFQPGEIAKDISIVIKEDALCEPTEKFYVILKQAENATIKCKQAEVCILNSYPVNNVMSKAAPAPKAAPKALTDRGRMIVSPNPANQVVNLRLLNKMINGNILVELMDQNGRVVKQWIKNYDSEEQSIQLAVADIPSGIYIVVIKDGKGYRIQQQVVVGH